MKTKNSGLKYWFSSYYLHVLSIFFFVSTAIFFLLFLDRLSDSPSPSAPVVENGSFYETPQIVQNLDSSLECKANKTFIELSLLYWKANVNGTGFSYETEASNANLPLNGSTNILKYPWGYGFNLGAGKEFVENNWDVGFLFTYFNRKGKNNFYSTGDQVQVALKGTQLTTQTFTSSAVSGHVEYDNLDVYLRKNFLFLQSFYLSPAIGVRTSWLDLLQQEIYTGGSIGANRLLVKEKSKFWGIGPSISGEAKWFLPSGFYLKSALGMAVEYGPAKVSYKESYSTSSNNTISLQDRARCFLPNFDYDLSIGYGDYIPSTNKHLNLEIGFGGNYWFNGSRTLHFYQSSPPRYHQTGEDVNFYGLRISAAIQF